MSQNLHDIDFRDVFEVLESLGLTIIWLEEGGQILYATDSLVELLGFNDKQELLSKSLYQLEPDLSLLELKKRLRELKTGKTVQWEVSWVTAEKKQIEIEVEGYALQRKGSSQALWLIKDKKDGKLEAQNRGDSKSAVWHWDLKTGKFQISDGFYDIFQLDKSDYKNKNNNIVQLLKEQLNSEQIELIMEGIKSTRQTKKIFEHLLEVELNDKKEKILFRAEPQVVDGQVSKLKGIILKQSSLSNGSSISGTAKIALDHLDSIILLVNPDCSIHYGNRQAMDMIGYSEWEMVNGLSILQIDFDSSESEWEGYWEELKEKGVSTKESVFQRKDGTVFPVSLHMSYLESDGKYYICVSARDITSVRKREQELEAAIIKIDKLSQQREAENIYLKEEISSKFNFYNIVTKSKEYEEVLKMIKLVAPTDSTVLIIGETGTGKELLARAIHQLSRRKDKPLVRVNCAALPENLIESELFGHEKGAFTGAINRRSGKFEMADGGTIFLDEIGELPLNAQSKLLRVLQEGEFEPVGASYTHEVNVRVITATNRNLKKMAAEGSFREDLFYRLNVFPIENIPLRERKGDIPLLVEYFIEKHSKKTGKEVKKLNPEDMESLKKYSFPGNVRELENIIERSVILSTNEVLDLNNWQFPEKEAKGLKEGKGEAVTLEEVQKQHIISVLEKTKWRVSGPNGAAKILGLKDTTLFSKMKRLGIHRDDYI